jgi:lysozyme family protein
MATLTQDFWEKIQKWEGDYQNYPNDSGNYNSCGKQVGTNHGITSKTVETLMGIRCPDEAFMRAMTEDYAFQVLEKFMQFYRVDEIADQALAELLLNNFMGLPKKAAETAQIAANRFGAGLKVDGAMGSKTITALNSLAAQNQPAIYSAVLEEWIKYLKTTQPAFRQGLLNRVNGLFFFPPVKDAPAPVAETANILRIPAILTGAAKGNMQDIFAVVFAVLGLSAITFAVYKLLKIRG